MTLLELFCDVDDFCQTFRSQQRPVLGATTGQRRRQAGLSESEIMTIVIHFHQSGYRTFKAYYTRYVQVYLRCEFPDLVSYNWFVRLMARVVVWLWAYLMARCGRCTGSAFIDSTSLKICHNRRIRRHRVFARSAKRGHSSMGWFYGFKLHLVVNEVGEILAFHLTAANVDDRQPVPDLVQGLFGKLFGDKGYLSLPLFRQLLEQGIQLITALRANMKNQLMSLSDKLLLRRRYIIETINDQLKNQSQIEHSRHRSPINFMVNLLAGLLAYTHQPKKPTLNLSPKECRMLALVS